MCNRLTRIFLLLAMYGGMACGLAACGVATAPVSEAAKAAPNAKPAEAQTSANASHCSAVNEKSVRGACHQHAPSAHHGGMCQPQSIPYARCRSHISTCNLGNTSPVQLFNCEHQRGYTSSIPRAGALMSIGVNHVHHMSTGHTLYVEEVCPNPDGTYKLRVSHTNYDRQCHLEEDAWVHYDPRSKHADFNTGHWAAWGKHLPVQGFILHEPVSGEHAGSPSSGEEEPAAPVGKKAHHKAVEKKALKAKPQPAKKPARHPG